MGLIGSQEKGRDDKQGGWIEDTADGFLWRVFLSIAAEKGDGNAKILKKKINLSLVVVGLMLKNGRWKHTLGIT